MQASNFRNYQSEPQLITTIPGPGQRFYRAKVDFKPSWWEFWKKPQLGVAVVRDAWLGYWQVFATGEYVQDVNRLEEDYLACLKEIYQCSQASNVVVAKITVNRVAKKE